MVKIWSNLPNVMERDLIKFLKASANLFVIFPDEMFDIYANRSLL